MKKLLAALLAALAGCAQQPTAPANETPPAGKVADPFTNSTYHFSFDLRWHGTVPRKAKEEIQRAADDLADILRFNSLLATYLDSVKGIEHEGYPSTIGGEWVNNKVIVYASHTSWSGASALADGVWGVGGPALFRERNSHGVYYPARPLVGFITISEDTPDAYVYDTALHELIHVMGFSSYLFEEGDVPHTRYEEAIFQSGGKYFWRWATAKTAYGITESNWENDHVPLYSDKSHWAENINDIMNPTIGSPLTTLTLSLLADIGYVVDDEGVREFRRTNVASKPAITVRTKKEVPINRCIVNAEWIRNNRIDF